MILLIDNYDSFTYNVLQLVGARCGASPIRVVRNDELTPSQVLELDPEAVILSPGPGHPRDAGLSVSLPELMPRTPMLGICLGHQALAWRDGARVGRSPRPLHGRTSPIHHDGRGVFEGLPDPFPGARYHSLVVDRNGLPPRWHVSAWTDAGDIMGLRHDERPHHGIQFHPESFLTECGGALLENFLRS